MGKHPVVGVIFVPAAGTPPQTQKSCCVPFFGHCTAYLRTSATGALYPSSLDAQSLQAYPVYLQTAGFSLLVPFKLIYSTYTKSSCVSLLHKHLLVSAWQLKVLAVLVL